MSVCQAATWPWRLSIPVRPSSGDPPPAWTPFGPLSPALNRLVVVCSPSVRSSLRYYPPRRRAALSPRSIDIPNWADRAFFIFTNHIACDSQLTIAISFGGPAWPISVADLNLGPLGNGQCMGAIFDFTQGANAPPPGEGFPAWIIGDTFLVRFFALAWPIPLADGFASACRKMCTVCSTPTHQLSALHNCPTQLTSAPINESTLSWTN